MATLSRLRSQLEAAQHEAIRRSAEQERAEADYAQALSWLKTEGFDVSKGVDDVISQIEELEQALKENTEQLIERLSA